MRGTAHPAGGTVWLHARQQAVPRENPAQGSKHGMQAAQRRSPAASPDAGCGRGPWAISLGRHGGGDEVHLHSGDTAEAGMLNGFF